MMLALWITLGVVSYIVIGCVSAGVTYCVVEDEPGWEGVNNGHDSKLGYAGALFGVFWPVGWIVGIVATLSISSYKTTKRLAIWWKTPRPEPEVPKYQHKYTGSPEGKHEMD